MGHTGAFCVCYAALNEINAGMGIVDVVDTVTKMRKKRKYMVQEKVRGFCFLASFAEIYFIFNIPLLIFCHSFISCILSIDIFLVSAEVCL